VFAWALAAVSAVARATAAIEIFIGYSCDERERTPADVTRSTGAPHPRGPRERQFLSGPSRPVGTAIGTFSNAMSARRRRFVDKNRSTVYTAWNLWFKASAITYQGRNEGDG